MAGLLHGDVQHLAHERLSEGSAGTYARARRVMSTATDRTYTTTVGSQELELPLVALSSELTIALLITVDRGVSFAETAGRNWPS